MKQSYEAKVCIIGGGPAGATTSLFLSKNEIPHIVIDKKSFPRDKVCGESFDGRVLHNLNRLSPKYMEQMVKDGTIIKSWQYTFHSPKYHLDINFPKQGSPRLLTQRYLFDNFLMDEVKKSPYAQVFEDEAISKVEKVNGKTIFKSKNIEVACELGIIAAGNLTKLNNQRTEKEDVHLVERRYYKNFPFREAQEVEIYFVNKPAKGYIYMCPAGSKLYNVEIYIHKKEMKKSGKKISTLFDEMIDQYPDVRQRINSSEMVGKPKGTYMSFNQQKLHLDAGENLINVGASAFAIHTMTGAGVGNAMAMARLASEAIVENFEKENFAAAVTQSYFKKAKKNLQPMVRANIFLNFFLNNIKIFTPIIFLVAQTKSFKNLMQQTDLVNNMTNIRFLMKNWFQTHFKS